MIKKLLSIFLIVSTTSNSFAQNVTYLNKDDKAQYEGYLVPKDMMIKIKSDIIELDTLRLNSASYERSINLYKTNEDYYQKQTQVLLTQNDKLTQSLQASDTWNKLIWFGLGIFTTGIALYGVRQITK